MRKRTDRKPSIFVTREIPEEGIKLLQRKGYKISVRQKSSIITYNELKHAVKNVDALLCLLTDPINKSLINSMNRCRVISNCAVGYNNIDVDAASKKGIAVTNTPGVLTDATADFAFSLLLAAARHIVTGDKMVREGKFKGWEPLLLLGKSVYGKTLGIIGAGRIGTAVAKRASGFSMKILYVDQTINKEIEKKYNGKKVGLKHLLRNSDFVSVHVPLTKQTFHLIGKEEFNLMKNSAVIVNTARGEVIDEKSLTNALKKNKIYAAGLDVFEKEPKVTRSLLKLPNIVLAPHIASATDETRIEMARIAARNIIGVLEERGKVYRVN